MGWGHFGEDFDAFSEVTDEEGQWIQKTKDELGRTRDNLRSRFNGGGRRHHRLAPSPLGAISGVASF